MVKNLSYIIYIYTTTGKVVRVTIKENINFKNINMRYRSISYRYFLSFNRRCMVL